MKIQHYLPLPETLTDQQYWNVTPDCSRKFGTEAVSINSTTVEVLRIPKLKQKGIAVLISQVSLYLQVL